MSKVLAVCGKGGVGKTTLAALLARAALERENMRTLIIDADPTGGLSLALGLPIKQTINDLRKDIAAAVKEGKGSARTLATSIDYRLAQALTEYQNLAFLAVGRPEEEGCFCAVNSFLRDAVQLLAGHFDLTIIDAEAGVEQVNRRVMERVDRLILVSDLSLKGLRVAETVSKLAAATIGCRETGLVLNRLRTPAELTRAVSQTPLPVIGHLPEDEAVYRYDTSGQSFLTFPESPALQAARLLIE